MIDSNYFFSRYIWQIVQISIKADVKCETLKNQDLK